MRRMLRCKALAITAAIISFTVISAGGAVATAAPAMASINFCNVFGDNHCLGDSGSVSNGDPVVLTVSGRDMNMVDQHFKNNNEEVYQLQFVANTSQCVGIPGGDAANLTVRDCSGGNSSNVNWARHFDTNGYEWRSTTKGTGELYMASDNDLGDQLFIGALDACSGCLFKWTN